MGVTQKFHEIQIYTMGRVEGSQIFLISCFYYGTIDSGLHSSQKKTTVYQISEGMIVQSSLINKLEVIVFFLL